MPLGVVQTSAPALRTMMAIHTAVAQSTAPHYALPESDVETAPGEVPYGPYFAAPVQDTELAGPKFAAKGHTKYARRLAACCCIVVLLIGTTMLFLFLLGS